MCVLYVFPSNYSQQKNTNTRNKKKEFIPLVPVYLLLFIKTCSIYKEGCNGKQTVNINMLHLKKYKKTTVL